MTGLKADELIRSVMTHEPFWLHWSLSTTQFDTDINKRWLVGCLGCNNITLFTKSSVFALFKAPSSKCNCKIPC